MLSLQSRFPINPISDIDLRLDSDGESAVFVWQYSVTSTTCGRIHTASLAVVCDADRIPIVLDGKVHFRVVDVIPRGAIRPLPSDVLRAIYGSRVLSDTHYAHRVMPGDDVWLPVDLVGEMIGM